MMMMMMIDAISWMFECKNNNLQFDIQRSILWELNFKDPYYVLNVNTF